LLLTILIAATGHSQHELWGTVSNGGQHGSGYIFRTDSAGDSLRIVHHFNGTEGNGPGRLVWDGGNKLYGMTGRGGTGDTGGNLGGTIYEYDLAIDSFRVLYNFNVSNTSFPYTGPEALSLMEAMPGALYGHMTIGGLGTGLVFSFNPVLGTISTVTVIPTFLGGPSNTTQGNNLSTGTLFRASDGFLYGTTSRNSQCPIPQPDQGSIIRIDPVTNGYSVLYLNPCSGADGFKYRSSFIEHNSKLYSVTRVGGANGEGVIYEFDPSTGIYVKKYDFLGGVSGKQPSTLTKAINGKFYSTALGGIPQPNVPGGGGIIFEYDPSTGIYAKKLDFIYTTNGSVDVGINPIGIPPLLAASNGKLYGHTSHGIFEYDLATDTVRPAGRYPWFGANPSSPTLTEICRKPSYRYSLTADYALCEGDSVHHDLQSSPSSILWKLNGVTVPLQTDSILRITSVSPSDTGTWVAELTNSCGTTVTQPVRVTLDPTVSVITQNGTQLQAPAAATYQWIDCDSSSLPIAGETAQVFTATTNGHYAVVIVNNSGCVDTSACVEVNSVGLNEESTGPVSVYPNPVQNTLYISTEESIQSITVSDASGRQVMSCLTSPVNVSQLAPGSYFLTVVTGKHTWRSVFLKK